MLEIIPVLDIECGIAVSGKSGERAMYGPLKTIYSNSSNPLEIAKNISLTKLYVADLDGIIQRTPNWELLKKICKIKKVMIDLGIRSSKDLEVIKELDCDIVIGTETLNNLRVLKNALNNYGNRIWISLDIKNNEVLSKFLPSDIPAALKIINRTGANKIIILDISAVGTLNGTNFTLLKSLKRKYDQIEFVVGGGIMKKDIDKLEKIGIKAVLIGTAFHKGLLKT
jgi:phosphoribosylformimino-5-aminoimidazole carboxamide ribotide isomerase|tara:strand:+ start:1708 stop:2385 length:678 start_codon:yes stop_codon:yes gene_type:complete